MVIRLEEERPQLRLVVQRRLNDIRLALVAQPPTSTWGAADHGWALTLLDELGQDWETEGIRVGALHDLGQLSHQLDMVAATVTRANLEALSRHVRLVLNAAALNLEQSDPDRGKRRPPD
jgi:hypothetical protein